MGLPTVQEEPHPLREQPRDLPLPGWVHVGPCQPRPWSRFKLKLNFFVCPNSHGFSGPAPLLQTSLFPGSTKKSSILWRWKVVDEALGNQGCHLVTYLGEGEEARESWLAEDLERQRMDFDKICSS